MNGIGGGAHGKGASIMGKSYWRKNHAGGMGSGLDATRVSIVQ